VVGRNVWTRGAPQEDVLAENVDPDVRPPLKEIPVIALVEALDRALSRAKIRLTHEVSIDRLSVSERINQLSDRLEREGSFTFQSCFLFLRQEMSLAEARHEAVVTFLAVLEMARLGLIRVWQELVRTPSPGGEGEVAGASDGARVDDADDEVYEDDIVIAPASPEDRVPVDAAPAEQGGDQPAQPGDRGGIDDDYR
jgi:segregation and condensation protein A